FLIAAGLGLGGMYKAHVKSAREAAEFAAAIEQWIRAGEEPPTGLHPILDRLIAEHSRMGMKLYDEAMQGAEKSVTRERAPDLFKNLSRFHTDAEIEIDADAVRRLYAGKVPGKDDGILGWDPTVADQLATAEYTGGYIRVKAHDWLAYIDKNVAKEL